MPSERPRRRTPEDLLREVQAEELSLTRGRLKLFLGYASGVGKSFRMLDEARRRRKRGQDIVVAAVQPGVPPDVGAIMKGLEVMPATSENGVPYIDMAALLKRHPSVCVIDGLAYDNPPNSPNPKRWQDAEQLLRDGISVISSINIQYVDELQQSVEQITGKHVEQTVPVAFLKGADEIELVDAPPEEPIERTPEAAIDAARRAHRLSKLREMALVLAADVVDHQLNAYLKCHGIDQQFGAQERLLVCVTPRANVDAMMETAAMIARRFHAELTVAYVRQPDISPTDQAALDEKLEIARKAGAAIEILEGDDAVDAILQFAHSRGITQLFIGHSRRSGAWARFAGNPVERLIRKSRGMDVRVFPQ